MKIFTYFSAILLLLNQPIMFAQSDSLQTKNNYLPNGTLTIEPGIGLKPGPTTPTPGLMISNLVQWNITKRLNILSHTSYTYNNAFLRDFNYITTNYSNSLSQKFGVGTSLYGKRSSHTFSFMAGIQFDNFKETLNNPEFENLEVSSSSLSPDFGLIYNLKIGKKKYFFSYRMYLPLYPYPFKSSDITSIDGNISNLSMEVGLGIRLK